MAVEHTLTNVTPLVRVMVSDLLVPAFSTHVVVVFSPFIVKARDTQPYD